MKPAEAKKRLKNFLADKNESWDLAEGALLIACQRDPAVEPLRYLSHLDQWAGELKGRMRNRQDAETSLNQLAGYLGQEQGFRGNKEDYYNPENSLLNKVLENRQGIPLSLSILYLSVAARLALPLSGIPLPGHFLVASKKHDLWYDPFEGGKRLSGEDLQQTLEKLFGNRTRVSKALLKPMGKRLILARLVRNLKQIYVARKDLSSLLWCVEQGLLLEPREPELLKERGLIFYQMGQWQPALDDLSGYLGRTGRRSGDPDSRRHVELLYRILTSTN
jgi:regulator of sirC expression with transglutaminase-like and TPR domain